MPAYYAGPLRRGLTRMGAGNLATTLIPETMDNCLSYSVLNYLKRLKNQVSTLPFLDLQKVVVPPFCLLGKKRTLFVIFCLDLLNGI